MSFTLGRILAPRIDSKIGPVSQPTPHAETAPHAAYGIVTSTGDE
jgi:hypothetical protein